MTRLTYGGYSNYEMLKKDIEIMKKKYPFSTVKRKIINDKLKMIVEIDKDMS